MPPKRRTPEEKRKATRRKTASAKLWYRQGGAIKRPKPETGPSDARKKTRAAARASKTAAKNAPKGKPAAAKKPKRQVAPVAQRSRYSLTSLTNPDDRQWGGVIHPGQAPKKSKTKTGPAAARAKTRAAARASKERTKQEAPKGKSKIRRAAEFAVKTSAPAVLGRGVKHMAKTIKAGSLARKAASPKLTPPAASKTKNTIHKVSPPKKTPIKKPTKSMSKTSTSIVSQSVKKTRLARIKKPSAPLSTPASPKHTRKKTPRRRA